MFTALNEAIEYARELAPRLLERLDNLSESIECIAENTERIATVLERAARTHTTTKGTLENGN